MGLIELKIKFKGEHSFYTRRKGKLHQVITKWVTRTMYTKPGICNESKPGNSSSFKPPTFFLECITQKYLILETLDSERENVYLYFYSYQSNLLWGKTILPTEAQHISYQTRVEVKRILCKTIIQLQKPIGCIFGSERIIFPSFGLDLTYCTYILKVLNSMTRVLEVLQHCLDELSINAQSHQSMP